MKCESCKKKDAHAIIRTFAVCPSCFEKIRRDNTIRANKELDILPSLDVFTNCPNCGKEVGILSMNTKIRDRCCDEECFKLFIEKKRTRLYGMINCEKDIRALMERRI